MTEKAPVSLLEQLFVSPNTPEHAFPFDCIQEDSFAPAMKEAMARKRVEIDSIVTNPEEPTFANTVEAFEEAGSALDAVCGAFYNLLHANSTPKLREQAQIYSAWLSELSADISLNQALFARIQSVYQNRDSQNLTPVQKRLLKNLYDGFVDSGALLKGEQREEYRKIHEELSRLKVTFAQNKLNDEQGWSYLLPIGTKSIQSLPEAILQDAQSLAAAHKQEGYRFTLSMPHYSAIMRFCSDARIRESFYRARQAVGYGENEYNNCKVVRNISDLRLQLANLLGYESYAHYILKDRMLHSPKMVTDLLSELRERYLPHAQAELAELREFAKQELEAWDLAYYMERYSEEHFKIKEEELRPYFPLPKVIKGVFTIAERLYGIRFRQRADIPVYHPDVQTFSVLSEDDTLLGLLYLDFFPRTGKQSGAWMNNLREKEGKHRPHVLLVMNFTPPTKEQPVALLTPSEVNTFLHEFGHSLHGLLTQAHYTSMSGTNVKHDFVELPSQFMENFLLEEEVVTNLLSGHWQSGESLPHELLHKLLTSQRYPAGYATMRQLFFGFLDMAYHGRTKPLPTDWEPQKFEEDSCKHVVVWRGFVPGCCISTSFSHIFSGGYAAGYYGYKWSEILDADAFSLFKERGIWDKQTATDFRTYILEPGDEEEPDLLYKHFRHRAPSIDSLILRDFPPMVSQS